MVDYDRLFQQHVDRSIRYTHLHSYAFFLETSHWQPLDFDKAVWSKLPAVWNHLPHYDWVMWIDADAMCECVHWSIWGMRKDLSDDDVIWDQLPTLILLLMRLSNGPSLNIKLAKTTKISS